MIAHDNTHAYIIIQIFYVSGKTSLSQSAKMNIGNIYFIGAVYMRWKLMFKCIIDKFKCIVENFTTVYIIFETYFSACRNPHYYGIIHIKQCNVNYLEPAHQQLVNISERRINGCHFISKDQSDD